MSGILETQQLTHIFPNGKAAIQEINLSIKGGSS